MSKLFKKPVQMPWSGHDVPHAVIEVNQCCNLDCRGCYKNRYNYQKPLSEVLEEIDFIAEKRNLATLTLAGGEPTMHPHLPAMIAHIASKGIRSQLLTNASLLTKESIDEYKTAGLNRVAMHIDKGQRGRLDCEVVTSEMDLNPLREKYIDICVSAGIEVSLVFTLYKDALDEFGQILEIYHHHPRVGSMLITVYGQDLNAKEADDDGLSVTNMDVYRMMQNRFGALPSWYVPSTHDEDSYRWIFYTTGITTAPDGEVSNFNIDASHPMGLKVLPKIDRLMNGKYTYEETSTAAVAGFIISMYGALSFSPSKMLEISRFLAKSIRNRNLKIFGIVFQQAPNQMPNGDFDTCKDCPDATVRNGKIIPVCLVDRLEPLLNAPSCHQIED